MNISALWNMVFLAGFVVIFAIRIFYMRHTKKSELLVRRVDAVEVVVLAITFPAPILILLYLFTPWLGFADYRLPIFVQFCGALFMVASIWLFWRSHADLGQNWSVALKIHKGHRLITNGVYRLIRHPMYASALLLGVAQGLMLQNWLAGWYCLVVSALAFLIRIPREEKMMREFFGQEYIDYKKRTGRIFPRSIA